MLTKDELTIKIIDFGSCKDMEGTEFGKKLDEERKKQNSRKPLYKDFVGTPNYMAPECCRNKGSDQRSDLWSLGCLLYQLFTGFPPFLGKSEYLIFIRSTEAKYFFPENIVDKSAQDLISKLIVIDPSKRLTLDEVLKHEFLNKNNSKENETQHFDSESIRKNDNYEKYPMPKLSEYAFLKIRNSIRNKYLNFRNFSFELKNLKEKQIIEEEAKNNGIEQDKSDTQSQFTEKDKMRKQEFEEKINKAKIEVEEAIENSRKYIADHCKDEESKKVLIDKFNFLERQIKHELFDVDIEEYFNAY